MRVGLHVRKHNRVLSALCLAAGFCLLGSGSGANFAAASPAAAQTLLPFFDQTDQGSGDPAPLPPILTDLDQAVLDLCGPWGSQPDASAFQSMMLTRFPDILRRIQASLDHGRAVSEEPQSLDTFAGQLADDWFGQGAFVHVFCGEPGSAKLGGFHFAARYWQAQQQGWAGRLTADQCPAQDIQPPVYTVGVLFQTSDISYAKSCPKGYALDAHALDVLIAGERAVQAARRWAPDRGHVACLYDPYAAPWAHQAVRKVVVLRDGALRTLYPDLTPDPDLRSCR